MLRAIDFIYKEAGVNRPLKVDDKEEKNLNGTKYRNQLNKVANAVKEIVTALKSPSNGIIVPAQKTYTRTSKELKSVSRKTIALASLG